MTDPADNATETTSAPATQADADFQHLQMVEDAICYRAGRMAVPCPSCPTYSGGICDYHKVDQHFLDLYREDHSRSAAKVDEHLRKRLFYTQLKTPATPR